MKEAQGPTPAGTSRPYRSLSEALRAHRIDPTNHAFIKAIVDGIGISSLIDRGRYIEAIRRGEGASLHIGRTYTNGFTEDERVVVGAVALRLQPSEGRAPYFYVSHPTELLPITPPRAAKRTTTPRVSAPRAAKSPMPVEERDYGVCDVCFMVKTPAGGCGCN
ncbi:MULTISPECIES: hypothetical protein [unclassified Microbacterium]|uniref:hypothetical protein n=1 Tax=unclassified Microbacterium TaxID=2609290 RepID=UPI000CFA84F0|nr:MULTISPECIES: hypothetical protein [unclassified Microbacterium]PQZ54127.1 hypothetical protein CQ032_14250 [Microbacterium sp. MYb43]PQZ81608.1 hypothetical protein CQ031_05145 [Microbacterium sp. MYb40]PRB17438.1 hypothetical protein CQ040_17630 [Microbacterium sp. MYb54]PRB30155.1 hypothetical protein CQ037_07160 [Microbacterium sp. MYb50]PRB64151.1 hypothetical protein CQ021_15350 [Microbacterium sp. MYb24]